MVSTGSFAKFNTSLGAASIILDKFGSAEQNYYNPRIAFTCEIYAKEEANGGTKLPAENAKSAEKKQRKISALSAVKKC